MDYKEMGLEGEDSIRMVQNKEERQGPVEAIMNSRQVLGS